MKFVVVDNGASRIKYGFKDDSPSSIPNCTAQVKKQMLNYVGDQVDTALNGSLLHYSRPYDHGYMTKPDIQLQIWNRLFYQLLKITPNQSALIMTEPPFNFSNIQYDLNEMIFEEYNFAYHLRRPSTWFSAYEYSKNPPLHMKYTNCCTVIDSGFSYTHIIPYINLKCQTHACKRVDIGGKLLTNYLKELVSYRQWNMMDEFKLIEHVKEELCYVSLNVIDDLKASKIKRPTSSSATSSSSATTSSSLLSSCILTQYREEDNMIEKKENDEDRENTMIIEESHDNTSTTDIDNTYNNHITHNQLYNINENHQNKELLSTHFKFQQIRQSYVLPDFQQLYRGYVKPLDQPYHEKEQLLMMETERFCVPEVLFQPQIVGMNQGGLSEAFIQSYHKLSHEIERGLCSYNILLTGGNANMPQFAERLYRDIRPHIADQFNVHIYTPYQPEYYAWKGAQRYINDHIQDISMNTFLQDYMVSKQEYMEYGHDYCLRKYNKAM